MCIAISHFTSVVRRRRARATVAGTAARVTHTVARFNSAGAAAFDGIGVDFGSLVAHCVTSFNGRFGIAVTSACHVYNNVVGANGSSAIPFQFVDGGICVDGSGNRIDSNSITANPFGIDINADDNFIVRNSFFTVFNRTSGTAGDFYSETSSAVDDSTSRTSTSRNALFHLPPAILPHFTERTAP